jgi:acetyl-CoA carboxylase biotin carboxyl carrier protein
MTIEEIKELIHVVNESGIAELEVARGDNRVRIRRSNMAATQEIVLPATTMVAAAPAGTQAATPAAQTTVNAAPLPAAPPVAPATVPDDRTVYVKSPIVGTFYESASPGSGPFVKAGDRVSTGQVLCIIESMKLMNEIESDVAGTVIARLVENGRPVEYGESLFAIQPA